MIIVASCFLPDLGSSMSNLVNSEAHFAARAREYGIPDDFLRRLDTNGIATIGGLAFAISRPGTDLDERTFTDWVRDLNLGVMPPMGVVSAIRRLHFESEVILTSSLRASVESSDSSTPKPLPITEKNVRMAQVRRRLAGLNIEGAGEPSQTLIEECCYQHETRVLKHIEAARCTSRENELQAGKVDKRIHLDGGSLAMKDNKQVPDESISSTYQLSQCLRRRGIAYEFAGLISFNVHEHYSEQLLRHVTMEPPPGYNGTSLAQALRADKAVFSYMQHHAQEIREDAAGVRPLDDLLRDALRDYNTTFHLLPLPKLAASETAFAPKGQRSESNTQQPGPSNYAGGGKGKSKGKGRGKGSHAAPKGYVGCTGRDGKGRPICFDFNTGECQRAPPGGTCNKGRHVCFKAGCFRTHSFKTAHADEAPKQGE